MENWVDALFLQQIDYKSQVQQVAQQETVQEVAPTEEEVLPKILEFIGDYPIVAHNAIFDYSFLNEASIRTTGKELTNPRVDSQQMFKEVYPEMDSHGLEALTRKFDVELTNHRRAMADTMGLALAYPKLKKLYLQRLDWQKKQLPKPDIFDHKNYFSSTYNPYRQKCPYKLPWPSYCMNIKNLPNQFILCIFAE